VKLIGIDHVGISLDFDGGGGVIGWNSLAPFVKRLSEKGSEIREAVLTEARNLVMAIDIDETANYVFFILY
jgi:microsomal dipeptidase-like Zn-dependent dipeptidase